MPARVAPALRLHALISAAGSSHAFVGPCAGGLASGRDSARASAAVARAVGSMKGAASPSSC